MSHFLNTVKRIALRWRFVHVVSEKIRHQRLRLLGEKVGKRLDVKALEEVMGWPFFGKEDHRQFLFGCARHLEEIALALPPVPLSDVPSIDFLARWLDLGGFSAHPHAIGGLIRRLRHGFSENASLDYAPWCAFLAQHGLTLDATLPNGTPLYLLVFRGGPSRPQAALEMRKHAWSLVGAALDQGANPWCADPKGKTLLLEALSEPDLDPLLSLYAHLPENEFPPAGVQLKLPQLAAEPDPQHTFLAKLRWLEEVWGWAQSGRCSERDATGRTIFMARLASVRLRREEWESWRDHESALWGGPELDVDVHGNNPLHILLGQAEWWDDLHRDLALQLWRHWGTRSVWLSEENEKGLTPWARHEEAVGQWSSEAQANIASIKMNQEEDRSELLPQAQSECSAR